MENLLPNPQPKLLGGIKTTAGGFILRGGACLLLIWLALFCFPVNNASAETLTMDGYNFKTSGTNCIITGYSGSGGAITIPGTLSDGTTSYTVTSIGDYAFQGKTNLTGVTIPDNLTTIKTWAFEGCSNLTSVTIPNGVISIEDYAFANCTSLTSVTIPKSVTSIGIAFCGCNALQYIFFDGQPTTIDGQAFYAVGWEGMTRYFYSPASFEFSYVSYDTNTSAQPTFSITSATTHCSITPSTTTGMPGETISLKISVDPGYTLQSLKYNDGSNDYTINGTSFTMPAKAITISVMSGYSYTDNGDGTCTIFGYEGTGGDITIPDTLSDGSNSYAVTSIGDNAFYYCSDLTSVTIPDSVTTIGKCAFYGTGLTSVIIPDSVTAIGESAFDYCRSLANVTLGKNLVTIGRYAFSCSSLTCVTIPDSVTTIEDHAFSEYEDFDGKPSSSLTSVTLGTGIQTIGEGAFRGTHLTSVTIPASVESIGTEAFGKGEYFGDGSSSLVAAYFRGDKPTLGSDVFKEAAEGFTVYIPTEYTTSYSTWTEYSKQAYSYGLIFKGTQKKSDGTAIRFIAPIDSLEPDAVGFVYSASNSTPTIGGDDSHPLSTTTVYTSIIANGSAKTAADLGGEYIVACPVSGISSKIYVRTFVTKDGITEYGGVFTVIPANLK